MFVHVPLRVRCGAYKILEKPIESKEIFTLTRLLYE